MTYTGISSDTSSSTTNSLPSDLAPFIGTSTIDLPISTLTTVTTVGGTSSGLASYADLSASAGATVTYNYTVPEPGTLLLLGSGLLGLFVWRKRRS